MRREQFFERFDRQKVALKEALVDDVKRQRTLKGPRPMGRVKVDKQMLVDEYLSKRDNPLAWMLEIATRERTLVGHPKARELAEVQVALYAKEMEKEMASRQGLP